jgi:hypothetical protein
MQGWSWMAALTLVASISGAFAPAVRAAEPPPVKQKVKLSLRLDGLSAAGGEIEIKPGHAGCKFETLKFETKTHPKSIDGKIDLDPIEVETVSANRDCSFTITLKEPGQEDKTVRRTIRIVPPVEGKPAKPQELTCYISSNSLKPRVVAESKDSKKTTEAAKPDTEAKRKK